jgi:hypothetical protein
MSIARSLLVVAVPLVFLGGCAAGAGQTSSPRAPRAVATADKPTEASPSDDKTTVTVFAGPRSRRGQPACDGSPFALIGGAHSRSEPHWIDCRSGERVEYSDAEFDAWFASRHGAKAPAAEAKAPAAEVKAPAAEVKEPAVEARAPAADSQ